MEKSNPWYVIFSSWWQPGVHSLKSRRRRNRTSVKFDLNQQRPWKWMRVDEIIGFHGQCLFFANGAGFHLLLNTIIRSNRSSATKDPPKIHFFKFALCSTSVTRGHHYGINALYSHLSCSLLWFYCKSFICSWPYLNILNWTAVQRTISKYFVPNILYRGYSPNIVSEIMWVQENGSGELDFA